MKSPNVGQWLQNVIRSRFLWSATLAAACTTLLVGAASAGWSTFSVPGDSSLSVNPQLLDRDGNLWFRASRVGGGEGYYIHNGASTTPFMIGGHRAEWGRIFADSSGNVWVPGAGWYEGTAWNSGSFRFDGSTWYPLSTATGLPHDTYESGAVDRHGVVWLAGFEPNAGYVSRFDGTTWTDFPIPERATLRMVDSAGRLWFDGGAWVARFDGNEWYPYVLPPDVLIKDIIEDRDGRMWFVSRKKVHRLQGTSFVDVTPTALLRPTGGTTFSAGFADLEGTVWVCQQFPSHLLYYEQNRWRAFTAADGAPVLGSSLRAGFCDRSGTFWLTEGDVVWRFDGEILRDVTGSDGVSSLSSDFFHPPALCTANGDVWVLNAGGVDRYDGIAWKHYSTADGLPSAYVLSMCEAADGALWIGTHDNGVGRFVDGAWTTFNTADGLGSSYVDHVLPDALGGVWTLGQREILLENFTFVDTLSHFDGAIWTVLTSPGLLPFQSHSRAMSDRRGRLWVSAIAVDSIPAEGLPRQYIRPDGLYRYDGVSWTHYTENVTGSGYNQYVWEDRAGRLWCATEGLPLSQFDGTRWVAIPTLTGLGPIRDTGFAEDRRGDLWFASGYSYHFDGAEWTQVRVPSLAPAYSVLPDRAGRVWFMNEYAYSGWSLATNYDGENFRAFGTNQGFPTFYTRAVLADSSGGLWFDSGRLMRYVPDRAAPSVAFISKPPRRSPTGSLSAAFKAAFEPASFVEFSYRLDGGAWSSWSAAASWAEGRVPDGEHELEVLGRDYVGNISPFPALARFEVDATPPVPVLSSPAFGTAARGSADITGRADDARFANYRLERRITGTTSWDGAALIVESLTSVSNGVLGTWDTTPLPDGSYDLRLSVTDSLGLIGTAITTVVVDNHAPFFDETAPAKVPAATGGDVYTTNAETHLYFPPHAFAQDAVVMVIAAPPGSAPATLPSGGAKALDGYEMAWAGTLKKPARFTLSYAGASLPSGTLALYRSSDGTSWERLGGTVDANAKSISLAVSAPGRYALYADNGLGAGTASLSPIAFTPRVFSPTGGFADTQVGISFTLGKSAPVTVKVYSRSGRLVREVVTGQPLSAGANLVPWDGTDRNGGYVVDGIYLVTVEALGQTETKTLAVVK